MSGKRYTEEFKVAAVKQVIDRDHPAEEVAVPRVILRSFESSISELVDDATGRAQAGGVAVANVCAMKFTRACLFGK